MRSCSHACHCAMLASRHVRLGQNILLAGALLLCLTLFVHRSYPLTANFLALFALAVVLYGLTIRSCRTYYQLFWRRYRRERRWFADKQLRPSHVRIEPTDEPHEFL